MGGTGVAAAATSEGLARIAGLVHGFERRLGPTGGETRDETRARIAASLAPAGRLLLLKQVHGARVCEAPWEGLPEADAGVALGPGQILGIETADCLPVLIVDPRLRRVAAAHAGWRGTHQQVAPAAVQTLLAYGSQAADLLAVLGPAIGVCCYEVGDELRAAFAGQAAVLATGPRGRAHLDLRATNTAQLLAAGLSPEHIGQIDECTHCQAALYHSYRRDGPGAGRMISYVGYRAG